MPPRKVVLMYHSVDGPNVPAVRGSRPISFDRFRLQISAARERGWAFGRISQVHEPVERDTLYITGDDGTVDWAANVLPWCEREGIPTHTAIFTGPWRDPPMYPLAHQLQVMLDIPGLDLPVPQLTDAQQAYADRVYAHEADAHRRYLKGACNVIFDDDQARALLGEPDGAVLDALRTRFAPASMYEGWRYAEVGVHTVTHRAFAGDADRYVREEVLPCRAALVSAGLSPTPVFTLPMMPRYPARAGDLVPALRAAGFTAMLAGLGPWDGESFIISRTDAKDAERAIAVNSAAETPTG